MKGLNAIRCNKTGETLISWSQYDFKMSSENCCGVDGGISGGYRRLIGNPENFTDLLEEDIPIEIIREQFTWGQNYDKDNNRLPKTITRLLKDLTTDHIIGILIYFTEKLDTNDSIVVNQITTQWKNYHLLFLEELKYRQNNNL